MWRWSRSRERVARRVGPRAWVGVMANRYSGHWQAVDARGAQHAGEIKALRSISMRDAMTSVAADLQMGYGPGDLIELTVTLAREGA